MSISPVGTVSRGQAASFSALASDPDNDAIVLTWAHAAGDCPNDLALAPAASDATLTYAVPSSDTASRFCVWAFATDRYGAMGWKNLQVDPLDRGPTANITLQSPPPAPSSPSQYSLYSDFQLSGQASTDPDDPSAVLTYAWTLGKPAGSTAVLAACAPNDDPSLQCFHADLPGAYQVSLTVANPTGTVSPAFSLPLSVLPDQLPCIRRTAPQFGLAFLPEDPTTAISFNVQLIADDGDPYDGGAANGEHFSWSYGPADDRTMWSVYPNDAPALTIRSGTFQLGDTAQVRLEIHDRNVDRINQLLDACGDAAPECDGDVPGCPLRVTWNLEFNL